MTISDYSGEVANFDTFLSYLDAMAMIISEMFGSNCEVVISDLDDPEKSILSIYNSYKCLWKKCLLLYKL